MSDPSPEISVIVPIYQRAPYLKEALDSVWAQTWRPEDRFPFEVLLIVDGSCEDFEGSIPAPLRPFVQIHRIAHVGVSGARNFGIRKARGEWVAFLDSDDVWLPAKTERQVALFEARPEIGMAYTNSFWIDKTGRVLHRTQKEQYGRLPQGDIHSDLMERDWLITSTLLVRREVFARSGGFDASLEVCEDWELKIRIAALYPVGLVDAPLIYYRLHAGGSHYKCEKMLECGYQVFDKHFPAQILNGNRGRLKGNVALNLAGSWLYMDQPAMARRYLKEAFQWDKTQARLYLMFLMSFFPKPARDGFLWLRDRIPLIP